MKDAIIVILFVLALTVGLPVLILWLRDRSKHHVAINRLLGSIALLFGLTTIGAVVWEAFHPTVGSDDSPFTIFQFLFLFVMVYVGWKWLADKGPAIEDARIDLALQEMEASIARAKATLPWFLDQVESDVEGAYVKFPLTAPNSLVEHEWALVEWYRDGSFAVSPSGDPIHEGEEYYAVALNEVEDWQVMYPDGRIKGAFSRIAMFEHYEAEGNKLSPKMRKQKAMLIDAEQGEKI